MVSKDRWIMGLSLLVVGKWTGVMERYWGLVENGVMQLVKCWSVARIPS